MQHISLKKRADIFQLSQFVESIEQDDASLRRMAIEDAVLMFGSSVKSGQAQFITLYGVVGESRDGTHEADDWLANAQQLLIEHSAGGV